MGNKYPCSARRAVEQYVIKDRLANMSIESGKRILDVVVLFSMTGLYEAPTHIKYQNVQPRVNGTTNIDTLFLTARE